METRHERTAGVSGKVEAVGRLVGKVVDGGGVDIAERHGEGGGGQLEGLAEVKLGGGAA
jgi:hypothetical protein